jgi:AraC family transcriptional regulator
MDQMELYIKNMVCPRCISAVKGAFENLNIAIEKIELGQVTSSKTLGTSQLKLVRQGLEKLGFELMDDKRKQLVEQIKSIIVLNVHHKNDEAPKKNLSDILHEELGYDYKYLSSLFSEMTGTTIEKFQINHKIERVKELILYDELSLKEIAYRLGYSSEAYLSNQFKKVTGYSPTNFKQVGIRTPLDQV